MQILDANGNEVQAICSRCGQSIKYVFYFRGLPYGGDCINAATGLPLDRWVVRNGCIGEEATAAKEKAKEQSRADYLRAKQEIKEQQARNCQAYAWMLTELEPLVSFRGVQYDSNNGEYFAAGSANSFINGLVAGLRNGDNPADWGERRLNVALEIMAKCYGRRGSKAYEAAWDRFAERIEETSCQAKNAIHAH